MLAETRLEESEDVVDLADSEQLYEQHGAEEGQHFPHADEDVSEVTRRLHLLLHLAQILDETCTISNQKLITNSLNNSNN